MVFSNAHDVLLPTVGMESLMVTNFYFKSCTVLNIDMLSDVMPVSRIRSQSVAILSTVQSVFLANSERYNIMGLIVVLAVIFDHKLCMFECGV
jgi:hypothetical protein